MKKGLIFYGGWDGHQPKQVADHFKKIMEEMDVEVDMTDDLSYLADKEHLLTYHVIVPVITMSSIDHEYVKNIADAVGNGTGLIGCHGGMCDAFRENVLWQFITGGNWVSHPGGDGVDYMVEIKNSSSPLVEGIDDFSVCSEHYYLHVDPAVEVLATTRFPNIPWYHSTNKSMDMPVIWTKKWGYGRVYYNALGHHADIVETPTVTELLKRGMTYVLEGKDLALAKNLSYRDFDTDLPMY